MHLKFETILGVGLLAAANSDAQLVLYSQPLAIVTGGSLADFSPGWACYDDFTLTSGGTVNQVNWSGLDPSGVTGFTVSFWSDNGGLPGTLLTTDSISGTAGQTATGQYDIDYEIYNYSASLAVPFSAAPGTEYLVSIVGNGSFYWQVSSVGNSGVLQYNGVYTPIEYDKGLAFTLEGAVVPEPSTIALALCGASALLLRSFRKYTLS